ncbi:MAG: hypothetical protein KatS3mg097_113 [Candidatus Parcubacteria bacterium]|nr:MAG: hypothetical protein KatS3mg097_113 [Candidatus Parcubacteria bacterium]
MKTGIATLPLDSGKVPQWLFVRMSRLMRYVALIIVDEFGSKELVRRLADPVWFQSLSCAIGMDWNSSGTTTITLGALKNGLKGLEKELGVYLAGGKGKASRKTPQELLYIGEKTGLNGDKLATISKLVAKVDNNLIQDGFNLYFHSFIVEQSGCWAVVQQGMNIEMNAARRYHWLSEQINSFTEEPHSGIISSTLIKKVLNLVSKKSKSNKEGMIKIINEEQKLSYYFEQIFNKHQKSLFLPNIEFSYHPVIEERFDTKKIIKTINCLQSFKPSSINDLLLMPGVGSRTIRALSLLTEVILGAQPSFEDPARYTFVYGGKDGTPYPLDRETYDETLKIISKALYLSKQNKLFLSN